MLFARVLTAGVLLAVLGPLVVWGSPLAWGLLSLLLLGLAAHEWGRLIGTQPSRRFCVPAVLLALGLWVPGLAYLLFRSAFAPGSTADLQADGGPFVALLLALVASGFWLLLAPRALARLEASNPRWLWAAVVLAAAWVALYELRLHGPMTLLSAMAIVWLADIGAYFSGRAFGRRKLAPRVSPGKSWEGVAGGLLLVTVAAGSIVWWFPGFPAFSTLVWQGLPVVLAWPLLAALVALSVVGDLHESLLKRLAGVKDSGRLLPGHGGVLDRIDALLPAMPVCLLILELLR